MADPIGPIPVLPVGSLADYIAESGGAGTGGMRGYTSNPVVPLGQANGQVDNVSPTPTEDGELTWRFQVWENPACECGQECVALVHEAQTDFWFQFYGSDCGGVLAADPHSLDTSNCNPDDLCDPCWDQFKVPFEEGATDAYQQTTLPGTVLANVFPFALLNALGFTGQELAQWDFIVTMCDEPTIELDVTFRIPATGKFDTGCPPGLIYDPLTQDCLFPCPPGTVLDPVTENCITPPALASGGHLGFVDPPLPRWRPGFVPREAVFVAAPVGRRSSSRAFSMSPPHPLAPDSNGFARAIAGVPLPVHPVISAAQVAEICGTCGADDSAQEELDAL